MRYAIISDIHGNLDALHTALEAIDRQDIDRLVCLGDIVGYGAEPGACIELVRSRTDLIVIGNHDLAMIEPDTISTFSRAAAAAAKWTIAQLTSEQMEFLRGLPYTLSEGECRFVHASPRNPEYMSYLFSSFEARTQADAFPERLCFIGHTHVPGIHPLRASVTAYTAEDRFIIGVGSIGQPRDGDARLSYGILDTVAGTYENVRRPYDVESAAKKIRQAGLPSKLADRLSAGI